MCCGSRFLAFAAKKLGISRFWRVGEKCLLVFFVCYDAFCVWTGGAIVNMVVCDCGFMVKNCIFGFSNGGAGDEVRSCPGFSTDFLHFSAKRWFFVV